MGSERKEKPGVILTRVRVPGTARVLLPEPTSGAVSDGVSVHCRPRLQSYALAAIAVSGLTHKILLTPTGRGSSRSVVPGKTTLISRKALK